MIGQTVLHYTILAKLGEGGMGEVYVARDARLGRKVAFKVLPPLKASDAGLRARFEREARLVASLNHPNIVTVYSVEEAEDLRFLTMELVEGGTLAEKIPAGGLPLEDFFALALPLCDAVSTAHDYGITHRDLKPGNVMVTPEGWVKVLDFGLATLEAQGSDGEDGPSSKPVDLAKTATAVKSVSGTVPYMSPEQLHGEDVGHRSDIFSLGVVLYEMLAGVKPFASSSSVSLIVSIVRDDPPPLRDWKVRVPARLERIVRRCLEKDPEKRYASVRELGEELRNAKQDWESGVTTTTMDAVVDPTKSVPRPRPDRRLRAGLAALAVVAVFLGTALFSFLRSPGDGASSNAHGRLRIVILPFENLGPPQEEYFAAGVTEEITSRLAMASGLGVISRNSAVQYLGTAKSTREIGAELDVDYILEGTVRWERPADGASRVRVTPQLIRVADDTHLWSQRYDRVLEDIFEVQSEIATEVIRQLDVALFPREREALQERPTASLTAYESYLRGIDFARRLNYSAADGARALEHLGRAVERDPSFADAFAEISQVHSMLYHFGHDRSAERGELAKRAVDRALELKPDSPDAHLALGYYHYWVRRDYGAALAELDLVERTLPGNPALLEARAYIERRQGLFEDARTHLAEALELNPRDDRVAREMGGTLFFLRRYEEAVRYYDRAIAFAPDPLSAYQSKARALWRAGDLVAARAALEAMPRRNDQLSLWFWYWQEVYEGRYEEALARLASTSVESIQWTVVNLPIPLLEAYAQELSGDQPRARAAYDSARVFLENAVEDRPEDARLRAALGHAYAGLGRREDAIREGRRSVELLPMSRDVIFGVYRKIEWAMILTKVGEFDAAFDEIEAALAVPSQLSIELLKLDPRWAPLRGHERFSGLAAANRNSEQ